MPINYNDQGERRKLINQINDQQNKDRKEESLKECEIYNDDIRPYVTEYLTSRFTASTVSEMPVIASVNLAKKITDTEASIYTTQPERSFSELTDDQTEVVLKIYDDMEINHKMMQANRFFKLQQQTHVKVFPKKGKLVMRNYKNHHIDAEPNDDDPETARAYIFSGYDKEESDLREYRDGDAINSDIADEEDYQSTLKRYVVWTGDSHFVMDGMGNIITEQTENPIMPHMPVFDISENKDFEYFASYGNAVTDFCVEFNGHLSSLAHQVDLQGFAQAFVKGPMELLPKNLTIGPNHIVYLPIDPTNEVSTEFGFANPNGDIEGSQKFIESLLSMFLSSKGIDPKTISGGADGQQTFSSGIERLLSMIDKFEASRNDVALFEKTEKEIYQVVKAWHNTLLDTDMLDDKYKTTRLPDDSELSIKFSRPELITTDQEKLTNIEKKIDLGLVSQKMALMEFHEVDETKAEEIQAEIMGDFGNAPQEEPNPIQPRPDEEVREPEAEGTSEG